MEVKILQALEQDAICKCEHCNDEWASDLVQIGKETKRLCMYCLEMVETSGSLDLIGS